MDCYYGAFVLFVGFDGSFLYYYLFCVTYTFKEHSLLQGRDEMQTV